MPIPTPEERVGQRVAHKYVLKAILGRGGMGVVYEAEHSWTGRPVAVKLLLPELARDESVAKRFLQEARTAAKLRHRNVVDVLDMGAEDDQTVYMVLELLAGEPLSRRLSREGPLGVDDCLTLLLPIFDALEAAHAAGVTHRDIKPDNIFISRDSRGEVIPKLLDFGVARVIDARGSSDMATHTGQPIGTPWFMAPEQARGDRGVGPSADLWAMAVVLYRCLSGGLPFHDESALAAMHKIVRGEHVPLHTAAPSIPGAVARVVEAGLSIDPLLRHRDARSFAAALEEAAGRPLPARQSAHPLQATVPASDPGLSAYVTAPTAAAFADADSQGRSSYEPARQTSAGSSPRQRWGLVALASGFAAGALLLFTQFGDRPTPGTAVESATPPRPASSGDVPRAQPPSAPEVQAAAAQAAPPSHGDAGVDAGRVPKQAVAPIPSSPPRPLRRSTPTATPKPARGAINEAPSPAVLAPEAPAQKKRALATEW